ncbi:hypothetical protein FOMPIDRAFT_1044729 [Fomitopsis schrenkii]|uniref:Uncharacterized protein n=1 Tax=Fomitopsis schrenkii TaxID=2126942 RepID=S8EMK7_FOMSC|nr:hypothetical protein FOMPIDRAFT_1044729 [Fomitopsis schrenkii]
MLAILDACHSGTLLDLDHYDCNKVYFPWVSLGSRDAKTRHVDVVRKNDTIAPVLHQKTAPAALLESVPTLTSPRSPFSRSLFSPLSPTSKSIRHSRSLHHKAAKQPEEDQHENANEAEQAHRRTARELRRRRTTATMSVASL